MWLGPVPRPTGSGTLAMPRQLHELNNPATAKNTNARMLIPKIQCFTTFFNAVDSGSLFAPTALGPRFTGSVLSVQRRLPPPQARERHPVPGPAAGRAAGTTAEAAGCSRHTHSEARAGWCPAAGLRCRVLP